MDKFAFSELMGQDIGNRVFLDEETEELSKEGAQVDPEYYDQLQGLAYGIDYMDAQTKLASTQGAYQMLDKMASLLEEGDVDGEALYGEIKEAMSALEDEFYAPADENEDAEMFELMVKGASEQLAANLGLNEPTEDLIDYAIERVSDVLQGQ